MKKINTLAELKAEQRLLRFQKMELEIEIKKDFEELKAELAPLKMLTGSAGKALSSENNGLLSGSLGYLAELLTKNVFLKNSGFLSRMIIPFLVKNTTSNLVEDNKPKIVDWITNLISRFSNKERETVEE